MSWIILLANAIGMAAGMLLLTSGIPLLREQLRHPSPGTAGERQSRLIMALGNSLWVISGVLAGLHAVILMCGINTIINIEIWRRMKRCQQQELSQNLIAEKGALE